MSRVIGCAICECDIEGMHHDPDCPNHSDNFERPDAASQPSDEAKLAFIKAHTKVMGEWEVTTGWEEALAAGLKAAYAVDRLDAQQER